MDEQTELLREMRDLLRVMAEPALAERDKKLRTALLGVVGNSKQRAEVVILMDGKKSQADLRKQSGMDSGNMSRLVTALRAKQLIKADDKYPDLVIAIPPNFFDNLETRR